MNPYKVVEDFEQALCEYTGAPYAVTTTSCTMALLLAMKAFKPDGLTISVPKRTYVGVPMSIINAGGRVRFVDYEWEGFYQLFPYPLYDSARYFTKDLFKIINPGNQFVMICVSFHASKTLGLEQGGAILHCIPHLHERLLRLRFDGRKPGLAVKDDVIREVGLHCPMIPSVAAAGLAKLSTMKDKLYPPLPMDDYPDLSLMEVFK